MFASLQCVNARLPPKHQYQLIARLRAALAVRRPPKFNLVHVRHLRPFPSSRAPLTPVLLILVEGKRTFVTHPASLPYLLTPSQKSRFASRADDLAHSRHYTRQTEPDFARAPKIRKPLIFLAIRRFPPNPGLSFKERTAVFSPEVSSDPKTLLSLLDSAAYTLYPRAQ